MTVLRLPRRVLGESLRSMAGRVDPGRGWRAALAKRFLLLIGVANGFSIRLWRLM